MNNKFDGFTMSLAQPAKSVTRCGQRKQFSLVLAGVALMAGLLALPAANRDAATSTLLDPAGDAVFPYLYEDPVPPYLDVVKASVSSARGVFTLEIQVGSA